MRAPSSSATKPQYAPTKLGAGAYCTNLIISTANVRYESHLGECYLVTDKKSKLMLHWGIPPKFVLPIRMPRTETPLLQVTASVIFMWESTGYIRVWELYNELQALAKDNGYATGNLLGEYTEKLCADVLGLELVRNNHEGFDAYDPDGNRLQIKGRQIKKGSSAKLTTLWNLDFDFIVAVVFDKTGKMLFAQMIPMAAVLAKTKVDPKKNCRRYVANIKDVGSFGIVDITSKFSTFLKSVDPEREQ